MHLYISCREKTSNKTKWTISENDTWYSRVRLQKECEGSSLESVITSWKICVQPSAMARSSHESSMEKMKNLLHHLVPPNNVKGTNADKTESQWANIILIVLKFKRDVFVNFDINKNHLDNFYFKLKIVKYHELPSILKLLITLTYGQASIERGVCIKGMIFFIVSNILFGISEFSIFF